MLKPLLTESWLGSKNSASYEPGLPTALPPLAVPYHAVHEEARLPTKVFQLLELSDVPQN
jgi:hypothetical protein